MNELIVEAYREAYKMGYNDALKQIKAEVKKSPYKKSYENETDYIPKHRVYEIIDKLRKRMNK